PNNPTKGATDAVVAKNVIRFSSNVSCAVALRCRRRCSFVGLMLDVLMSAPLLKTGTSGVNRSVTAAVETSDRFRALRKIFQNTSVSRRIFRSRRALDRMIPHDQTEKMSRIARTNRVTGLVVRNSAIRSSSPKINLLKLKSYALGH